MRLLHRGKPKQKGFNVPVSHLVDFILNSHRLTSRTQETWPLKRFGPNTDAA